MNNSTNAFGLEKLIAPFGVEDFLSNCWLANKPLAIQGDVRRFDEFPFMSEVRSLEKFAENYHGRVSMIHRNGSSIDVQSGKEALPYIKKGYTVYFRHIQNYFPSLRPVMERLASDLSVPVDQFTCEIFTSSGESGVPFHSDYDLNFSLLLSGDCKEWTYAKNASILNQTGICMPAGKEQIEPAQMEYLVEPLPSEMPANAITSVLYPGGLVFMPRGWWHTTHSFGDCLCINFVMKGPHWAHLFSTALEKTLISDPVWREYPYNVAAIDIGNGGAIQKFAELIQNFKETLMLESSEDTALRLIRTYLKK